MKMAVSRDVSSCSPVGIHRSFINADNGSSKPASVSSQKVTNFGFVFISLMVLFCIVLINTLVCSDTFKYWDSCRLNEC
jgi:hypothetical protein